jgi:hypothetical protein
MDDAPELDPSKLATISSDEAEKLLSYLQSRGNVPNEVYDQLREIIRDNERDNAEILVDALESRTRASININVSVEESPEDYDLEIFIRDYDREYFLVHHLYMQEHGGGKESDYYIRRWDTDVSESDIEGMIGVHESKLGMMRVIASLDELSLTPTNAVNHRVTR